MTKDALTNTPVFFSAAIAAMALYCACLPSAAQEPDGSGTNAIQAAAVASPASCSLTLGDAVVMALTNNRAFKVQKLEPQILKTFEDTARAAFDPVLSGRVYQNSLQADGASETNGIGASAGLRETLPTGTELDLRADASPDPTGRNTESFTATAGLTVTQPLLRGFPLSVNLVSLHKARLNTEISTFELRGFAENLVASIERAYWECILAERQVSIYKESLDLAEKQRGEIEQRILVGSMPETELAAAQAETALRREALINARSSLTLSRLRLLQLTNPGGLSGSSRNLQLTTEPATPEIQPGPLAEHIDKALNARPDLNEARLKLKSGQLDVVKTRNGLLPKLDLFINMGRTAYADSFSDAVGDIGSGRREIQAGIKLEIPFGNREQDAAYKRARLTTEQTSEALDNMLDLVRIDVEEAFIEVERTIEQISATATTRKFQEEKLRAETAKFNVGKSTAILVAQSQRDLVLSRVSEINALVRHLQAITEFYRLEGSLLERRGIAVPAE